MAHSTCFGAGITRPAHPRQRRCTRRGADEPGLTDRGRVLEESSPACAESRSVAALGGRANCSVLRRGSMVLCRSPAAPCAPALALPSLRVAPLVEVLRASATVAPACWGPGLFCAPGSLSGAARSRAVRAGGGVQRGPPLPLDLGAGRLAQSPALVQSALSMVPCWAPLELDAPRQRRPAYGSRGRGRERGSRSACRLTRRPESTRSLPTGKLEVGRVDFGVQALVDFIRAGGPTNEAGGLREIAPPCPDALQRLRHAYHAAVDVVGAAGDVGGVIRGEGSALAA